MTSSELLLSVPIEQYIGQYVQLEEKDHEYWGLSPFKEERTPSFSVRPGDGSSPGIWFDFAANGVGGNLIDFIMRYHHTTVAGAFRLLSEYAGESFEASGPLVPPLSVTSVAKRFIPRQRKLAQSTAKPLPDDYMQRYEFRRDKLQPWVDEGMSWDVLKAAQVRYDAVSDRIVFPIRDMDGRIISVCGRTCDPDFKEKGLRKYTYFTSLGTIDGFYGFSEAKEAIRRSGEIVLFEGTKSVLIARTWGIENTCALLTSHLNPNQFLHLVKLGVRCVFALDKDADPTKDGQIHRLKRYVTVQYLKDTDDLLSEKMSPVDAGREVYETLYNHRKNLR